ncbi:MAG: FkbM family methyltransferase, partial [Thaumarchaeota archaeon]|nr:FkbM family methyltransferase [Nitrososphaerota archaeon]
MIYKFFSNVYYKIYQNHRYLYNIIKFPMYLHSTVHGKNNPVSVNGWKMDIHRDDPGISAELALFKKHEPISTQIMGRVVREGDYCLDIGANLGYYVLLTAGIVGETGQVTALEPHPRNFSKLRENISLNNLGNVTCFNIACSNYDGKALMKTLPQSNWHMIEKENGNGGLEVEARKVDTLARNFSRLDFMRMDVEGHEYEIIQGSHDTIENF